MSAVTFFKTYIVGNQQPIGKSLIRLLDSQGLLYQDFNFSSVAQLKESSVASSFMVIVPSVYKLDDLRLVSQWLEQAQKLDIPVLFVSTLAIFPAPSDHEWQEDDEEYANTEIANEFLKAEALVQELPKHFILRAGLPLFLDGNDFASRFLQAVRAQQNWELNSTLTFSPTPSNDLAVTVLAMLQQANCADNLWGTYHCSGVEQVTAFQYGQALIEQARHYEDVPEVIISAVEEGGEQPKVWVPNANNTKLFHNFGIRPKAWRQGFSRLCKARATEV